MIMLTLADSITFFECQSPELLLWGQVSELADFQISLIEIEENEPNTLLHSVNRHRNLRLNIDAVFVIKTVQVISVQSGNPDDAAARGALAQALMQTGDAMEAWHYLEPAARANNADARIVSLAAKLTAQLGLPEAKLWQARQQRAQMSQAHLALFAQAQKAMSARDWQRADQIYAELLRGAPPAGDKILLNNAAYIRQQLGYLDGAERLIRRALTLGAPDGVVLDTASWILFQKYGATPEVRSMSARAEKLLPNNADVRAHAAKIRAATGQGPAA